MADSKLTLTGDFVAGKVYRLKGATLIAWRDALLADRVIAGENLQEIGTPQGRIFKAKPSGGSEAFTHPFKLTVINTEAGPKYMVSKGSITDGTNGTAIDLSGILEDENTATAGYVVIEADVDEDLEITAWARSIKSTAAEANEVGMTTTGDIRQNKIRLLLGKLTLAESVATPWQALFTSVRITYGVLNGVVVRVFEAAPTYPTEI